VTVSILCVSGPGVAGPITVDVYAGHTTSGGGAPYSDLVGSFLSPDIQFATNFGYAWHPFGLPDFGADMTGHLLVEADGTYTFTLDSDDGSMLFIDSLLVVDNGGPHVPTVVSDSVFLTAGLHPFEVQFFEDFGGPSGVDLILPAGVTYNGVPEPSTMLLIGTGLVGLLGLRRKFRS